MPNTVERIMLLGLTKFLTESNLIEGLEAPIDPIFLTYTQTFLDQRLSIDDLYSLVSMIQPGAQLRDIFGLDVQVSNHIAPIGGPQIVSDLEQILEQVSNDVRDPFILHHEYQHLHPFTDGNGRSGRLLWLWQLYNHHPRHFGFVMQVGFLHIWYYQSLSFLDTYKGDCDADTYEIQV